MDAMAKGILPCCLPCRKARPSGQQGTTGRQGTRAIVQHRLFPDNVREIRQSFTPGTPSLSLPARVRIQGEVDMIQQAKPAELVENDPERKSHIWFDLDALVILLQAHTPLERLSNMEARAVFEFMQQRGYAIVRQEPA